MDKSVDSYIKSLKKQNEEESKLQKDLLKQITAKLSQFESQINILTTLCDQFNERITLLADTNKTLS